MDYTVRKYDISRSPYQRLMESNRIRPERKRELKAIYLGLNPAQLERSIDAQINRLYRTYGALYQK